MIERESNEPILDLRFPSTAELIERYLGLSDEETKGIHERAAFLRNGPTGLSDQEAILAAMAEADELSEIEISPSPLDLRFNGGPETGLDSVNIF